MDEQYYDQAKKRVQKKKKFFNHLKTFIIINVVMNIVVSLDGDLFGFLPATLFWGMGLAFHYIKVFGIPGTNILTPEWEDEEIEKEMEKMKGGKPLEDKPASSAPPEEPLELKELRKNYDEKDLV